MEPGAGGSFKRPSWGGQGMETAQNGLIGSIGSIGFIGLISLLVLFQGEKFAVT
jgi:hypothetical protein